MSAIRKKLYRVLADNEDPEEGISARNPEATGTKVSSHVNGKKKSPYISTTATKKATKAYYRLAVKRYEEKNKENERKGKPFTVIKEKEKTYKVVEIDIDELLKDKKVKIENIFDLTTNEGRDIYLENNKKLKNYAKKYGEVLVKGFIPPEYVKVIDLEAMSNDEFSSEGYSKNDYTEVVVIEIIEGAFGISIK